MKTRFEIIPTEQYLLAIDNNLTIGNSTVDEEGYVFILNKSHETEHSGNWNIVAHLPLNGAKPLEGVYLLPELDNNYDEFISKVWSETPNPSSFSHNYPCVHHKDNDKLNLSINNLEWCTQDQNIKYASVDGKISKGEGRSNSKLTESQVIEIRERIKSKEITQGKASKQYGVSQSVIHDIVHRINWKHI